MSIDLNGAILVSLNEAVDLLPGRPHLSTLRRWCGRGVRGVRLETVVVGGRRFTSRVAIEQFIERTTAARDGGSISARPSMSAAGCSSGG
jgi:hypothetical protein